MPEKVSEYGEEENFIVTVDDDVLDNKYSDTEQEDAKSSTLGKREGRISDMVRKQTPLLRQDLSVGERGLYDVQAMQK